MPPKSERNHIHVQAQRKAIFNPKGLVHGTQLFSDDLHYILKGSKLFKNVQEDVNTVREHLLRLQSYSDNFKYKKTAPAF